MCVQVSLFYEGVLLNRHGSTRSRGVAKMMILLLFLQKQKFY